MQIKIEPKYQILYYAILLLIMMSWTDFDSFPSMIFRLGFMFAVLLPGLLDKDCTLVAAITCFWGIAVNGYAYSYMPTQVFLYVGILILCLGLMYRYHKKSMIYRGFLLPILLFFYVTTRNLLGTTSLEDISWGLLIFILFPLFIADSDVNNEKKMSWAFMTITSVLSYYSFSTQDLFAGSYGSYGSVLATRSGWTDPNYLSMIVGMGAVIGFRNILRIRSVDLLTAILSLTSFFMAVPAMMLLVSRGGMMCLCGGIAVLMLFSKVKTTYKIGVLSFLIIFVVILYTNDFLAMLEERLNDGGGGSNDERMWILQHRISSFAGGSPVYWFVGYGYDKGLHLGLPYKMGSHNDYVSFLAEYGIIGFIMFLGLLLLPIYNLQKNSKVKGEVMAYFVYLLLACLTLEPFSFGRWVYYVFLLFIITVVRTDIAKREIDDVKEIITPLLEESLNLSLKKQ